MSTFDKVSIQVWESLMYEVLWGPYMMEFRSQMALCARNPRPCVTSFTVFAQYGDGTFSVM